MKLQIYLFSEQLCCCTYFEVLYEFKYMSLSLYYSVQHFVITLLEVSYKKQRHVTLYNTFPSNYGTQMPSHNTMVTEFRLNPIHS